MATSLEESEKLDLIEKIHAHTYFHLVKKIVKIVPVDTEIALLILKKYRESRPLANTNDTHLLTDRRLA